VNGFLNRVSGQSGWTTKRNGLADLRKATGLSISAVLKRGLHTYASIVERSAPRPRKPYEIYRRLDRGPADNAIASASGRKERVSEIIRKKYGR